jgi:hypothetical protein
MGALSSPRGARAVKLAVAGNVDSPGVHVALASGSPGAVLRHGKASLIDDTESSQRCHGE